MFRVSHHSRHMISSKDRNIERTSLKVMVYNSNRKPKPLSCSLFEQLPQTRSCSTRQATCKPCAAPTRRLRVGHDAVMTRRFIREGCDSRLGFDNLDKKFNNWSLTSSLKVPRAPSVGPGAGFHGAPLRGVQCHDTVVVMVRPVGPHKTVERVFRPLANLVLVQGLTCHVIDTG